MNQAKMQSLALLVGRVGLGAIVFYYGSQKALGAFGGPGIHGTIQFMSGMHIPVAFAVLAICGEFLGSLGLILGLFTRVAAFGVMCTMTVASYQTWGKPDFANALLTGAGQTVNQAFYPLVNSIFALTILIAGAGDYSLDKKLFGKKRR